MFVSDAFNCVRCAADNCPAIVGEPQVTICDGDDVLCSAAAGCACERQGCRLDGPFEERDEEFRPTGRIEIHCRGD